MSTGLRPATAADYGLYVAFHAELGTGDEPLEPRRWQAECAPTSAFQVDGARAVGYVFWELAREHAYVRHVVVDPPERGRGRGRKLMLALAEHLRRQGASAWRLNVLASNAAALRLYERLGLRAAYSTVVQRLAWERAGLLAREASSASEAEPRLDGEHERRFSLFPGQLAQARAKSGVRILVARSPQGASVGIAVFDPSFPGAYPFRCEPAAHARTLIEGLRELYAGDKPWVQLVVEDAPPLVRLLESAGAERVHDIVHMRGELP